MINIKLNNNRSLTYLNEARNIDVPTPYYINNNWKLTEELRLFDNISYV